VSVDVKAVAVTEEQVVQEELATEEQVVIQQVAKTQETVVEEQPVVGEKAPPRLEEFPKPQALKAGQTLVLSCKVTGRFQTRSAFIFFFTKNGIRRNALHSPTRPPHTC